MTTEVDYHANFNFWSQGDKWKGFFFVVWLIVKDIPNKAFRQITNEYNEGKPITSSRDTQEIHPAAGMEALKIFKEYPNESSILDDFKFFEKKEDEISPNEMNLTELNPSVSGDSHAESKNFVLNKMNLKSEEFYPNKLNKLQTNNSAKKQKKDLI